MKLIIELTNNGAVVEKKTGEKEFDTKMSYVFDECDLDGLKEMLWDISDECVQYDKFAEKTIKIDIGHGSKYEGKK